MLVVFKFLSLVFVRRRVIFSYGTFKWTSSSFFPPADFLVHNRLNLFSFPYACWVLIYVAGGYKPECVLWYISLHGVHEKNEIRLQLAQNNERPEIFLCMHWAVEVSDVILGEDVGMLWGQQGLHSSDCKIGTRVSKGCKCKHTQRKWVTIPTLVLAHYASPRISETCQNLAPLCIQFSVNKQM